MKLCIVGTGYVGLVTGTCFADLGNKVYCVDKDKAKIKKLSNSISPIYEPGLDDLIRNNLKGKRLIFTDNFEKAVQDSHKFLVKNNEKFYGNIFKGKYIDCGTLEGFIKSSITVSKYL